MGAFFHGTFPSCPEMDHVRTLDADVTDKKEVIPYRKFILFYIFY